MAPCQVAGAKANVSMTPAASSITTNCGSFVPVASAIRFDTQMPTTVITAATPAMTKKPWDRMTKYKGRAPMDPMVPGPMGESPHPNQVASQNATGSLRRAESKTERGNRAMKQRSRYQNRASLAW